VSKNYRILSEWRVTETVREVMDVLDDVQALPRWWPAVYASAELLDDGTPDGVGRKVALRATGWLPYTLSWTSTLTEPVTERGFAIRSGGDMVGTGRWTFQHEGPDVVLAFDWNVEIAKPLVRRLTWLLKPVFAANHRWAMARGEESLRLELRRRRQEAGTGAERVPPPPGPTFRRPRMVGEAQGRLRYAMRATSRRARRPER
jgi:hypothetical protein